MLILLVLIALAARVDSAPRPDPIDLARRYADAITGGGADRPTRAPALAAADDDAGEDDDDGDGDDDGELATAVSDGDDDDDEGSEGDELRRALGDGGGDGAVPDDGDGGGALAMLDAELDPGDPAARVDAIAASAGAGAQEVYEQWMRHHRPSWLGRLDLGVSWRTRRTEPRHAPARSYNEIWLVATWRR